MKKTMLTVALAAIATVAYSGSLESDKTSSNDGVVVIENSVADLPVSKYKVETNRFWDNWFISVGGGAQVLFGDYSDRGDFEKRIAPTANISVGKWFVPGLGVRIQASGLQAKTFNMSDSNLRYGRAMSDGDGEYFKEEFNYLNLHGDVLFNLSALLGGYNENRVYEIVPYAGIGWNHVFDGDKPNTVAFNFGIINKFRLSPALDLNLELQGMLTEDRFDGKQIGTTTDIVAGATLGLTYKFKQRGFNQSPDIAAIMALSQSQMDAVNDALAMQIEENDRLKTQLANRPNEVVKEKVVVKSVPAVAQSVFFEIGSADLGSKDEVNLQTIANALKENTSTAVTLTGYADSATGSAQINKQLSEGRANAVADALVKMGVSRNRIKVDAKGGVDALTPPTLNRRVIIDVK